jgi:hypothetical protein
MDDDSLNPLVGGALNPADSSYPAANRPEKWHHMPHGSDIIPALPGQRHLNSGLSSTSRPGQEGNDDDNQEAGGRKFEIIREPKYDQNNFSY